jgi:hypothetical protein
MSMIYRHVAAGRTLTPDRLVDLVEPFDGPVQVTRLDTGESQRVEKREQIAFDGGALIRLSKALTSPDVAQARREQLKQEREEARALEHSAHSIGYGSPANPDPSSTRVRITYADSTETT